MATQSSILGLQSMESQIAGRLRDWAGTVAHQAPLSMGFPEQEYWSGLPFPSPEDFPDLESNTHLLHWQVDSVSLSHQESPFLA